MELRKKPRSPQKIVKNLKLLREEYNRASIDWCYKPIVSKLDECIYGEHTEGSILLVGNNSLNISKDKERSAPKIVKNLQAFQTELIRYQQCWMVGKTIEKINLCIFDEYNIYRK